MKHIGYIGIRADENTAPTDWIKIEPDSIGLKPEHTRLESKRMSRGRFKKVGQVVRTIGNGDFELEVDRVALLTILEAGGFVKTKETTNYKLTPVQDAKNSKFADIIIQDLDSGYETRFLKSKLDVSFTLGADDYVKMTCTVYASEILENQAFGTYTISKANEKALYVKNTKISVAGTEVQDEYSTMNLSLPLGASLQGAGSGKNYFEYSEDVEHTADVQFNAFKKNDYFSAYERGLTGTSTTIVTTLNTGTAGEDVVITASEVIESVEKDNTAGGKYKATYSLNPDSEGNTVSFLFKGMAS